LNPGTADCFSVLFGIGLNLQHDRRRVENGLFGFGRRNGVPGQVLYVGVVPVELLAFRFPTLAATRRFDQRPRLSENAHTA